MKKKKIIFLFSQLTQSDLENLNLYDLKKNFLVKFIDISKLVTDKKNLKKFQAQKKKLNYKIVKSFEILKNELTNTNYIFDNNFQFTISKKLNALLKQIPNKVKTMSQLNGVVPNFLNHSIKDKAYFIFVYLFYLLKYLKFNVLKKNILDFIASQKNRKNYKNFYHFYDHILVSTDLDKLTANKFFKNSNKIMVHNRDYERHILNSKYKNKSSNTNSTQQQNYAVFLDQAFYNHPDDFIFGFNKYQKKEDLKMYLKTLNNFFNIFEKKTQTKVIIAAHPRTINLKYLKYFIGRKIIFNKTYDLIKNAKLVFAHSSTSVGYAVILKKKLIFLNSSLMFNLSMFSQILSFSIETKGKHIFFDKIKSEEFSNFFNADFSLYPNYIRKYLKSPQSQKQSLWDITSLNFKKNKNFSKK